MRLRRAVPGINSLQRSSLQRDNSSSLQRIKRNSRTLQRINSHRSSSQHSSQHSNHYNRALVVVVVSLKAKFPSDGIHKSPLIVEISFKDWSTPPSGYWV